MCRGRGRAHLHTEHAAWLLAAGPHTHNLRWQHLTRSKLALTNSVYAVWYCVCTEGMAKRGGTILKCLLLFHKAHKQSLALIFSHSPHPNLLQRFWLSGSTGGPYSRFRCSCSDSRFWSSRLLNGSHSLGLQRQTCDIYPPTDHWPISHLCPFAGGSSSSSSSSSTALLEGLQEWVLVCSCPPFLCRQSRLSRGTGREYVFLEHVRLQYSSTHEYISNGNR